MLASLHVSISAWGQAQSLAQSVRSCLLGHGIALDDDPIADAPGAEASSSHEQAHARILAIQDASPACINVVRRAKSNACARLLAVMDETSPFSQDLTACASLLLAGADETLAWPGDARGESAQAGDTLVAVLSRWDRIEREIARPFVADTMVGRSVPWRRLLRETIEASLYSQAPVLITGPTGSGKELLASLVHRVDPREPKRELVTVDCTTLAKELSGSELFGHEKGAFTGAVSSRQGAVELADGGTLFLDEIGELPLELQAQFLRVLQERTFKRVGASRWERSDFRLVCATNRDLEAEVRAGRFRRDLFHRIAGMTVRTPALDEHREDILPLAEHFLTQALGRAPAPEMSPPLRAYVAQRMYEGNVRDLRQIAFAMARRYVGVGPLTIACLPESERASLLASACPHTGWREGPELESLVRAALSANATSRELEDAVRDAALRVAHETCGSTKLAALKLGVSERTVQVRRAARVERA